MTCNMICVMYKVEGMPQFCHAVLEDETYIKKQAKHGMWDKDTIVWFRIEQDADGFWKKAEVTPNADDSALHQDGRTDAPRDSVH
jgi:hypothetical protein